MAKIESLIKTSALRRSTVIHKDALSINILDSYVLTAQALQTIERIAEGIKTPAGPKAWTLTGPYGAGKSAFALFLSSLLAPQQEDQKKNSSLPPEYSSLAENLNTVGLLPVLITGRREPLRQTVTSALIRSLETIAPADFIDKIQNDEASLIDLIEKATNLAINNKYTGLLIIFDELGQSLDYTANEGAAEEIYLLQEIAEAAERRQEGALVIIGVLHQGFSDYAQRLGEDVRNSWAKVQGRFENIIFDVPPSQMLQILSDSIGFGKEVELDLSFITTVAKKAIKLGLYPRLDENDFLSMVKKCYPLHPATVSILPYIFKRFAQDGRSLFSYISSREPFGFQSLIQDKVFSPTVPFFIRVHDIFDYLLANLKEAMTIHDKSREWLLAVDILSRHNELSDIQIKIIKTIAVLSAIEVYSPIGATAEIIEYCVGEPAKKIKKAIDDLSRDSIIIFRNFSKTIHLWMGSDFDIERLLADARQTARGNISLARVAQQYLALPPFVARRHTYVTGTPRYFKFIYQDLKQNESWKNEFDPQLDGAIICCLSETVEDIDYFVNWAKTGEVSSNASVIVAVPQRPSRLAVAAHELEALHLIKKQNPLLQNDNVAKRELSERIAQVENSLYIALQKIIGPRAESVGSECLWTYQGKTQNVKDLSDINELVSFACDQIYVKSPVIQNELINRRFLSSNISAARGRLLGYMVEAKKTEEIEIEGYPPERSIYEALLKNTGIYRMRGDGWSFGDPDQLAAPELYFAWQEAKRLLSQQEGQKLCLRALADIFANQPYGILPGLLPVLICAFLLAHIDTIAIYDKGIFALELTPAMIERMTKNLDDFAIQTFNVSGINAQLLNNLSKVILQEESNTDNKKAHIVEIVRRLCFFVNQLPHYSLYTNSVSELTAKVRSALLQAEDPYRLIFIDMPLACGIRPFTKPVLFIARLRDAIVELKDNYGLLLGTLEQYIGAALGALGPAKIWRPIFAAQVQPALKEDIGADLRAFLLRIADTKAGVNEWIEGIATLLVKKPPKNWEDDDLLSFKLQISSYCQKIRALKELMLSSYVEPKSENTVLVVVPQYNGGPLTAGQEEKLNTLLVDNGFEYFWALTSSFVEISSQ